MCAATRLTSSDLQRRCRSEDIPLDMTGGATADAGVIGQERALEALRFGTGICRHGYNLFAIGPSWITASARARP